MLQSVGMGGGGGEPTKEDWTGRILQSLSIQEEAPQRVKTTYSALLVKKKKRGNLVSYSEAVRPKILNIEKLTLET